MDPVTELELVFDSSHTMITGQFQRYLQFLPMCIETVLVACDGQTPF